MCVELSQELRQQSKYIYLLTRFNLEQPNGTKKMCCNLNFFSMTWLNKIYDSVMKYPRICHGVTELNPKSAHLLETKYLERPPSGKVQFPFFLVNALIWSRLYVLMRPVLLAACSYALSFLLSETLSKSK